MERGEKRKSGVMTLVLEVRLNVNFGGGQGIVHNYCYKRRVDALVRRVNKIAS